MSRGQQWALVTVYLARTRRALALVTLTMVPLCILFARPSGYAPAELALNFIVLAALYPFAVGGIVTKSKADGSLAFLASLPVSAPDHARSWLVVVALLSCPIAFATMAVGFFPPLGLRGGALAASGLTAMAFTISAVMTMLALQLSAPPAMAAARFVGTMAALLVGLLVVGRLYELDPRTFAAVVGSPAFLASLSLAAWVVAAVAFWWAWQRIGHFMTSYVGDPPGA